MTEEAVRALRGGLPIILPTDTVYGLVASGSDETSGERLAALKGRPAGMPYALMAARVDVLLDALPDLGERARYAACALLPGALTLVLPNPGERFPWLTGARPATLGVRVPDLPAVSLRILEQVPLVASTSANIHGAPDPAALDDVPRSLRGAVGAVVNGGRLRGQPSTVVDLTGSEPVVLREGAVPGVEALKRARQAVP